MHRRSDIKHFEYEALNDLLEREGLPEEQSQPDLSLMFDARCRDPEIFDMYLADPRVDPMEKMYALADYGKVSQRDPVLKEDFAWKLPHRLRIISLWADKTAIRDEVNAAISGFYCGMMRMQVENSIN